MFKSIKYILSVICATFLCCATNISLGQTADNQIDNANALTDSIVHIAPLNLNKIPHNRYNSAGEKEGIWITIDKMECKLQFETYRNGKLSGVVLNFQMSFPQRAYKLKSIKNYSNGNPCGQWVFFGVDNNYTMIDNITPLQPEFISAAKQVYTEYEDLPNTILQGYYRFFYGGQLRDEGWKLFDNTDDISILGGRKIGKWTCFPEDQIYQDFLLFSKMGY